MRNLFGSMGSLSLLLCYVFLTLSACSKKSSSANPGTDANAFDAEVTVLANDNKQVIQGFGCATVFRPPTSSLTNEEMDRLFGRADKQVGLNILRIRVATDSWWRSIELANAKGAIQRNAKVIATPWSPPASMKVGNSLVGGSLIPDSATAYAKYLDAFAVYMEDNGAPLYAISIQNEPDIKVSCESCDWTATAMRDFLKNHGQLITKTKVIAAESFNNSQSFINIILNDDIASANTDIVGGHIYGSGIVENQLAKTKGKEVWMTEHLDTLTTYAANLGTAIEIHNCLTQANFNAYIWWYGKRFYGPIGEDGLVTKRGFIMSQFARFIKPGSVRLGTGSNTRPEVLISAYVNGGKKTIVAINNHWTALKQKISVKDANLADVIPYTTTINANVEGGAKITVTNNAFIYNLPPYSITTFVEQ